jgi:hypothetical protein
LSCFFEIELHHARFPTKISRGCKKTWYDLMPLELDNP